MSYKNDAGIIDYDEAIALLPDGDNVHTFRSGGVGLIIGADWPRADLLNAMRASPKIGLAGPNAAGMGHGLLIDSNGALFIETDMNAVESFETAWAEEPR